MPATIEQSAETATKTLDIPVSISLNEPGSFYCVITDPVVKGPKGTTWSVTWTLNPSDAPKVTFLDPPIIVTSKPAGVDGDCVEWLSATQARLTFTSNVFDVNVIRYCLQLDPLDGEANRLVRSPRFIIDPTIAIVEDPIGG